MKLICPECSSTLKNVSSAVKCREGHEFPIVDNVVLFVQSEEYSSSFGWQWQRWESLLSDERSGHDHKEKLIHDRTGWDVDKLRGKELLEIGCGGGDDTEVLLKYPLKKIYSFDLSDAVFRSSKYINDQRLFLFQASLYDMPVPDKSFDLVFCHRVIQHTPSPAKALRLVLRKIAPGGEGFVHVYRRNWFFLMHWKYKLRWLTTRMGKERIANLLDEYGEALYRLCEIMDSNRYLKFLRWNFIPFYYYQEHGEFDREQLVELGKLVTFDALTPAHDNPLSQDHFERIIQEEGCTIQSINESYREPLFATVKKTE